MPQEKAVGPGDASKGSGGDAAGDGSGAGWRKSRQWGSTGGRPPALR